MQGAKSKFKETIINIIKEIPEGVAIISKNRMLRKSLIRDQEELLEDKNRITKIKHSMKRLEDEIEKLSQR